MTIVADEDWITVYVNGEQIFHLQGKVPFKRAPVLFYGFRHKQGFLAHIAK